MKSAFQNCSCGYTIVELMVMIVLVSVFASTVGIFVTKLLTFQEQDREEAYVREKLADVCGSYADILALGSSISSNRLETAVKFRNETGGVSFETGRVCHVTHLISSVSNDAFVSSVHLADVQGVRSELLNRVRGDAWLVGVVTSNLTFSFKPLEVMAGTVARAHPDDEPGFGEFMATDTALGRIQVSVQYEGVSAWGDSSMKTVTVERVVRLWNRK